MPFTTLPSREIHEPITKAIWDILVADLAYLHGDAGAVTINNSVLSAGAFVAAYGSAAEVWLGALGPAGEACIDFGSGVDVNLYRYAANILKTDDAFLCAGTLIGGHGSAAEMALGALGPGGEAGMKFGSAGDVNLYRLSANILKTDDALLSAGTLAGGHGSAAEVDIGALGPGGEAGLAFGSSGDTSIYRQGAQAFRVRGSTYGDMISIAPTASNGDSTLGIWYRPTGGGAEVAARVVVGAAGTGPGGSGRALYVA